MYNLQEINIFIILAALKNIIFIYIKTSVHFYILEKSISLSQFSKSNTFSKDIFNSNTVFMEMECYKIILTMKFSFC